MYGTLASDFLCIHLQGKTPEALALAKEIDGKLGVLAKLVDDAIKREVAAGTRLPAATTSGQFDQAMNWIDDPRYDPNSIGTYPDISKNPSIFLFMIVLKYLRSQ